MRQLRLVFLLRSREVNVPEMLNLFNLVFLLRSTVGMPTATSSHQRFGHCVTSNVVSSRPLLKLINSIDEFAPNFKEVSLLPVPYRAFSFVHFDRSIDVTSVGRYRYISSVFLLKSKDVNDKLEVYNFR